MTITSQKLAQIWRHPIKAHGAESLETVTLTAGETLPWDRVWAVPHEAAKTEGGAWVACRNFTRGAGYPSLMAIDAKFDPAEETIELSHPDLANLTFSPERESQAFLDWVRPILPEGRPAPSGLLRATGQGMTDKSKPWLSILNLSSLRELSRHLDAPLDPRRFRGNLWLEGGDPWEENNWIGKHLKIGATTFTVTERITRCRATEVDPDTGKRNLDTLGALMQGWGHRDFGVYAEVTNGGTINIGDSIEVLS